MRDRQDYWLGHVTRFREGGETLRAYCERNGLSAKTFRGWRTRLGSDATSEAVLLQDRALSEKSSREQPEKLPGPPSSVSSDQSQVNDVLTSRTVRRNWSTAQKQQAVLEALRSGLPIERFAHLNGLTPSVLHRWKHQFARCMDAGAETDVALPPRSTPQPPMFATVSLASPPAPVSPDTETQRVEIVLVNGRRLHVGLGADMGALQRLLTVLEQPA